MDLGQVSVTLGLNSKDFMADLEKSEKEVAKLENNLKTSEESFKRLSRAMASTKNPSEDLKNAFAKIKTELKKDQNALNDFNSKLKKFDGGLTKGANGVNLLSGAFGKLLAGGAILALTKQIIDFSAKSVEAFRTQERAINSLNNSLINAGVYTDEYSRHLQELSSEIQSYSNYGDEAVEKSIALGQSFAGNIKLTDDLIKSVVDFAAATEMDLDSAFTLVGKSIGTNTNALARYGVTLDQNMTKEQKQAEISRVLAQRFNGSAKTMANTSVQLKNAIGDLSESFGKTLNPAIEKSERWLIRLTNMFKRSLDEARSMSAEISTLSIKELEYRKLKNNEFLYNFSSATDPDRVTKKRAAQIRNENTEIEKQIALLKKQETERVARAKKNTGLGMREITTGISSTKTKQDKALDEYKNYIQQYQKLTSDYQATVKARQYIEGTLNIDPIKQQAEYDKLLTVYQQYYAKIDEISKSGAKNKPQILKLEEENLARNLQEIRLEKEKETQQKLYKMQESYQEQANLLNSQNELNSGFWGGLLGESYKQKLELEKWYQQELLKIRKEFGNNIEKQEEAQASLEKLRNEKLAQDNLNTWQQYGSDVSNILSTSFSDILSGNETFSDSLKQLMSSLYQELIKMALNAAMKEIEIEKMKQATLQMLKKAGTFFKGIFSSIAGATGGTGGVISSAIINSMPKYHSGGVVPGTSEQIAVLKGGERVLTPAENKSYSGNDREQANSVNNMIMINVKAWDGKDVIQTLRANSQTINQIVNSGIKNNNQGLRSTVQNI